MGLPMKTNPVWRCRGVVSMSGKSGKFCESIGPHLGKIYGTIFGLLLGWITIRYGLLRGLFVVFCVSAGFFVGARYDAKSGVTDVIDRFLR